MFRFVIMKFDTDLDERKKKKNFDLFTEINFRRYFNIEMI